MPEGSSSRTYITDYRVPLSVCGDWSGAGVGGRGGEKCVLTTPTMISLCSRRESHRYLPDGGGAGRGGGGRGLRHTKNRCSLFWHFLSK